jgi:hypothetical protein
MTDKNGRITQVEIDELDERMRAEGPPEEAVRGVEKWLAGDVGHAYVTGVGGHTVRYRPKSWVKVECWPERLAEQSGSGTSALSRDDVTGLFRAARADGTWVAAMVAMYVWGSGPSASRLPQKVATLNQEGLQQLLQRAVEPLEPDGTLAAYDALNSTVKGMGPSFTSKFLYFLGRAGDVAPTPRPLILDKNLALVLRAHATAVGHRAGLARPDKVAERAWSDGGWTSHRYDVYLDWMSALSTRCLEEGMGTVEAMPEILELALFSGAWTPGEADQATEAGERSGRAGVARSCT